MTKNEEILKLRKTLMTKNEEILKIQEILKQVHLQKQSKLMNGMLLRKEIRDALDRGEVPKGYRVDWLGESSHRIMGLLTQISMEFNDEHKDDAISVHDLLDVLTYTMYVLKRELGEK